MNALKRRAKPVRAAGSKCLRTESSTDEPRLAESDASADEMGREILRWFLHGARDGEVECDDVVAWFFDSVMESRPLHVSGRSPDHFYHPPATLAPILPAGVEWSSEIMATAVGKKHLSHTTDVNIVKFDPTLKKRVPLRTSGEVSLKEYTTSLKDGWSVRFLRPQEHAETLSTLLFLFDEVMGCYTGMNSYWTPRASQGFAPHYDDVDVFLLQLEGSKRWLVYPPPSPSDVLCRESSPDYNPDDLQAPSLDILLAAGDMLYLPRGWIHQGVTSEQEHSLHLTVSAFQKHTYGDLLRVITTSKLDAMCRDDVELRKALPTHWWHVLGGLFNPKKMGSFAVPLPQPALRQQLLSTIRRHATALLGEVQQKDGVIDKGADLFAIDVLERRQPPPLLLRGIGYASSVDIDAADHFGAGYAYRLVSATAVRLVIEADEVAMHHCGGNSVTCLGATDIPSVVRFDIDLAPTLLSFIRAFPSWLRWSQLLFPAVADLDDPRDVDEMRIVVLRALAAARVLQIQQVPS